MIPTIDAVRQLGEQWAQAEVAGDTVALAAMVTDDFRLVGPFGFILDRRQWLDRYDSGRFVTTELNWHDVVVIVAGAVAAALGLVLLAGAVLPGAPIVLPLSDHPDTGERVAGGVTRRSLRKTLLHSAESTDGVASAQVRLRRRVITVKVRSHRLDLAGIDSRVQETLCQRLDSIELAERPALRVRVTQVGNRR